MIEVLTKFRENLIDEWPRVMIDLQSTYDEVQQPT